MDKYYTAGDKYILRLPFYTTNLYKKIFSKEDLIQDNLVNLLNDSAFEEMLLVSTEDLYKKVYIEKTEMNIKALNALAKYVIRCTTRTTPYGLFAGIDIGTFKDSPQISLTSVNDIKKRARVDMEWLGKFIDKFEKVQYVFDNLRVHFNRNCYKKGERLINPCVVGETITFGETPIYGSSIRFTPLVEMIKNICEEEVYVSDLKAHIKKRYQDVEDAAINDIIKKLVSNDFLITNLRVPLNNTNTLSYVLKILERNTSAYEIYSKLKNIEELIKDYNKTNIGEGIDLYKKICLMMTDIVESPNYLQVDLQQKVNKNIIDTSIKKEIELLVNTFMPLTSYFDIQPHLVQYRAEFIEKYGYDTEVPVMVLLDENLGLGAPASYKNPFSYRNIEKSDKNYKYMQFQKIILDKVITAIYRAENQISITQQEMEEYYEKYNFNEEEKYPDSMEIFCKLITNTNDLEKKNKVVLGGCIMSSSAGNSIGRFGDMISLDDYQKLCRQDENKVTVELSEMSHYRRLGNVVSNTVLSQYAISLGTNVCDDMMEIDLNDIYIGVEKSTNTFYAKSKALNRKITIKTSHMLNITYGSNLYRFLREISIGGGCRLGDIFADIGMHDFPYVPRIVFHNVIIQPACWRININNEKNVKELFLAFKKQMKIPRYVYIGEFDKRLLLDLQLETHISIAIEELKKAKKIEVLEAIDYDQNYKDYPAYMNELVIPLFRNTTKPKEQFPEIISALKNNKIEENGIKDIDKNFAILPVTSNWLYFKIYGLSEKRNEFLVKINKLLAETEIHKLYDSYFFIRYFDKAPHIRFRIKAKNDSSCLKVLKILMNEFNSYRIQGILNHIEIDTYNREENRYGGRRAIELAEEVFYKDSLLVNEIIKSRMETSDFLFEEMSIRGVISLMEGFGLSQLEMISWLSKYIQHSDFRKEYKICRKSLLDNLCMVEKKENNWAGIDQYILQREIALIKYKRELDELDNKKVLTNSKEDILSSLIHMFCNRLYGDNMWEKKIRAFTRHSLYEYFQRKKWYRNREE